MPKKRRKPSKPPAIPHGNIGVDTPAQMAGAVIRRTRETNGHVTQQRLRFHVIEEMASPKHKNGKPREPELSKAQLNAGLVLLEAQALTSLSPDSAFSRPYVQSTPDYGAQAISRAERSDQYGALRSAIPSPLRPAVDYVLFTGERGARPRGDMEEAFFKAGLTSLAERLASGKNTLDV